MFAQSNAANSITHQNDNFDDDDSDHEHDADESLVMTTAKLHFTGTERDGFLIFLSIVDKNIKFATIYI